MIFKLEKNCHEILLKSKSRNFIVSVAIGEKHYSDWRNYASRLWLKYCKRNNLVLIIIKKNLVSINNSYRLSPTWQRLLVANYLKINVKNIKNICLLDTDILINPYSPNVFKGIKKNKINVSKFVKSERFTQEKYYSLKKKLILLRRQFISKKYPLNSSMNASPQEIFKHLKFKKIFYNYFCAGLMVFNVRIFENVLLNIYKKYSKNYLKNSLSGGVEAALNYELMNKKILNWIEYKFQAIWLLEVADNFSFLYYNKFKDKKLVKLVIEQILSENYFLHFSGTLSDEKNVLKIKKIFNDKNSIKIIKNFPILNNKIKTKFYKRAIKGI